MKIIKRIKTLVLAVVMSLGVLLPSFAGITASATMSDTYYDARTGAGKISAKEAGRSSDPKYKNIKESYMNARYEYMIKTTDETEVTVNKEGQSSIDKGSYMKVAPDSNQYWKLENSWKGNITATYSHCGYYKGTEIDVKLTLMDWEFLDNNSSRNSTVTTSDDASNVYVYFPGKNLRNDGTNRIGVSAVYCSWIKVKYSFVKSGTNTAVNVQGYTTFNDIDACQGVNFIENYKDIITTNTADNLSCVILNDDDTPYIFDGSTSGANTNDAEKKNWVTNTFAGTSMTVAFTFASNSKSSTGEVNGGNGWIINYNKKAVRSEFASPVKTVSDSDEKEASSNTLNGREIFTYKISHHVPYEIEENWYSAYGIYDTLSNDLQLLNTDIRDETGKTYSGQVKYSQTPTSDGVRYLWLFEDVKREDFYDNTYIITLTVRLKDTVDISSKDYKITNYAQATFTGSTFSQSTDVITKVKPISPSISKYINSIGRESYSLHKNNEDITYTGTIFGGDAKQYSRVEINDTLAEGLTYKSLYIYDGNGNDITSYGTNSSRGSNVKFTFNSNRLNSIFNKNLTYKLVVTADKEYDGTATENEEIANTISLTVDGETVKSNTPKLYRAGVNVPVKSIDKSKITEKTETVTYTISSVVDSKTKEYFYSSYVLSDTFEDVLQYKSARVLNEGGTDVTSLFNISYNGKSVTARARDNYLTQTGFYGHTYKLEIQAYIKPNADLSDYCDASGKATIPNKGILMVDGNAYPSNTVNFTYNPIAESSADKYILNINGDQDFFTTLNGKDVTYAGSASIQNKETITSIVLSDQLDSSLKYKNIRVELKGEDITDWGTAFYDEGSNLLTFTFNNDRLASLPGEVIEYTIDCEYVGEYTEENIEILNTVLLSVNNKTVESNKPSLYVPGVNVPVKSVDKSEITKKTETVTYTISNVVDSKTPEYFYNSYVITDTLESVLEYKSAKVLNEDGEDVSDLFTIKVDENTITATAKDTSVASFYGHTYKLEIKASIIQNADLTSYMRGDKAVISNTSTLIVNKKDYQSNTVDFTYEPKANSANKYIVDSEGGQSEKVELFGETATYTGSAVVQDKTSVKSVVLSDKLDSSLNYKSISVSLNGKDVTDWGTANYNEADNIINFTFNSDKVAELAGETITYTLTCDFVGKLTNKSVEISNIMTLIVNDNSASSNEAILTTPVDPSITKYINKSDEGYSLHKNSEEITYTGTIIPGTHLKTTLSITDNLAEGLTYKSLKIYSEDGEDITSYGTDKSSGSVVNFVFSEDKTAEIYNTILSYKLVVTATKEYDGSATKDEETPNTILLNVEDETVESNTPKLYRAGVNVPVKSVDKSEITEKTETVTYTISSVVDSKTPEYFYNSYVLSDTLESVLEYKSAKVLNEDGDNISDLFTINIYGNTVTATAKNTNTADFYGHTYKLVIEAGIIGKNTDISKFANEDGTVSIPNTGEITVDGNVFVTNKATYDYEPISNSIDKLIVNLNGEKANTALLVGNTVTFTGTAAIQNKFAVTSVAISDKLDSNLKYKSMSVSFNNNDVSNWGKVSYDEASNTVTFTFNEDKVATLAGEAIEYTITCDYTGKHEKDIEIPNTTILTVNDDLTVKSNTPIVYDSGVNVPVKSVDKSEITKKTETVTYTISSVVDSKTKEYFYNNYVITDTLESVLEYKSAKVLNEDGEDVSDLFTIKVDENTITATAKDTSVASFYGHTYKLTIEAAISQNTDLNDYYKNGTVTIPNTSTLTVNGNNYQSNTVDFTYQPKSNSIDKYIVDSEGGQSEKVELFGETATYTGNIVVQDRDTVTGVSIVDKLDGNLKYKAMTLKIDDKDITEYGEVSYDEASNTVTFTFSEDMLASIAGETITYALVCDYVGVLADKSIDIPNTIQVKVNNDSVTSNEAILTTPVDPSITKYINKSDEGYSLHKNSEEITYTGTIIPGTHLKTTLSITDNLAEGLTYKSLKIYSEDGEDITSYGTDKSSGSVVNFVFSEDKTAEIYNTILSYKLVVTATKEYDGSATKDEETPNTILLNVEDETVESNTPKLYRAGVNVPVKSIDKSEITEKTETVTYTISSVVDSKTPEYFYNSYVITDTLESVLEYKSAKVLNEKGEDVSDLFTITEDNNTVTATTKDTSVASFYGHTYKLIIEAGIIDRNTDISKYCDDNGKATIPNTSTLTVDGNAYTSNTVDFTYQTKSNSVDKYIIDSSGEKATGSQLYNNSVTYTGNAVIKDSEAVTSIVLSDKLDSNLKYKEMKISLNDKDITNLGEITYDENTNIVSFSFNKFAFTSVVGETIEYALTCDYIGEYTDETSEISNIIDFAVNKETKTSNDTTLTIPVDSYITKHIYNGEELVDEYTLSADRKDNKVYYKGSILVSEKEPINSIVFSDKLDSNLEFVSISFLDGDTELECNSKLENGIVVATLADSTNLEGKEIQWKMTCNYVGDEKPTETVTIPNTANVNINKDSYSSNKVYAYVSMVTAYEATQPTTAPEYTPKTTTATKPAEDSEIEQPYTGDSANVLIWFMVVIVAALGIIIVVCYYKKAKKDIKKDNK